MPKSGRTYQVKPYLSKAGHQQLDEVLRQCCRLYNDGLQIHRAAYRDLGLNVSKLSTSGVKERKPEWPDVDSLRDNADNLYEGRNGNPRLLNLDRWLTELGAQDPEIKAIGRRIKVSVLDRLDRAFDAFFRRLKAGETPGFPRYKSAHRFRTLECHSGYEKWLRLDTENNKGRINIPGLPHLEFRLQRELPAGQPATIRITRTPRRVIASLVYNIVDPEPSAMEPANPVGIDAGVAKRIALSDGTLIPGHQKNRRKGKRLQRKLARSGLAKNGKGGKRWDTDFTTRRGRRHKEETNAYRKTRALKAKEEQRLTESNRNALHRLTTDLVRKYDFFAAEALQIPNMVRSAKGTLDNPGKNVRQKSGLNRGILEQGWGQMYQQIAYKAASAGKQFVRIPPAYTSQTCSKCGVPDKQSRRSQSDFVCIHCGHAENADVNAAKNILSLGLQKSSGGGGTLPDSPPACGKDGSAEPVIIAAGAVRKRTSQDPKARRKPTHHGQLPLPGFTI